MRAFFAGVLVCALLAPGAVAEQLNNKFSGDWGSPGLEALIQSMKIKNALLSAELGEVKSRRPEVSVVDLPANLETKIKIQVASNLRGLLAPSFSGWMAAGVGHEQELVVVCGIVEIAGQELLWLAMTTNPSISLDEIDIEIHEDREKTLAIAKTCKWLFDV